MGGDRSAFGSVVKANPIIAKPKANFAASVAQLSFELLGLRVFQSVG